MNRHPPRDLELFGFGYDPRVFAAASWYVNAQHASHLMGDEPASDRELAELDALFEARAQDIHELVRWSRIDRMVCVCGLVLRLSEWQESPVGHLEMVRPRLAGTVAIRTSAGFVAACQHCAAADIYDAVDAAREWRRDHHCPPAPTAASTHAPGADTLGPAPSAGPVSLRRLPGEGPGAADRFFRVMAAATRLHHPRSV